ncbi:hypothetical protein NE579_16995, partial [Intestinimonas massiliensis]
YHQLMPHVPGAVSPMIAAGRTVKHLHPDALTVFVGHCLAKKAEAREPDLRGAVDLFLAPPTAYIHPAIFTILSPFCLA